MEKDSKKTNSFRPESLSLLSLPVLIPKSEVLEEAGAKITLQDKLKTS